MKTVLKYGSLVLLGCLLNCKKEEPDVIKLDYTNLYESAAYALVSARENYNQALQSNNPAEIEAAKKKLQLAENAYTETKGSLTKGISNIEKQKIVEKVEATVNKPVPAALTKTTTEKTEIKPTETTPLVSETKPVLTAREKRKAKQDSLAAVRKANYEAFKAKARSDLQKDTVKARLDRFNKQVKDFFEGKK